MLDQVDDFLQDQILGYSRPNCDCCCDKAPDIVMNCISMTRVDMIIEDSLGVPWCIAGGHPKDAVHDDREIYNVAHHATDILPANRRDRSTYNIR